MIKCRHCDYVPADLGSDGVPRLDQHGQLEGHVWQAHGAVARQWWTMRNKTRPEFLRRLDEARRIADGD